VVPVAGGRRVERGQALQPRLVVLVQPGLVVVDEDRGGDVHGVAEDQALRYPTLAEGRLDLRGDVHEGHPRRQVKRQVLGDRLHGTRSWGRQVIVYRRAARPPARPEPRTTYNSVAIPDGEVPLVTGRPRGIIMSIEEIERRLAAARE